LGQNPADENGKFFLYLLNVKKTEFIQSSEMKCPKSQRFLLIIIGWGESGKVTLQVIVAVFLGAVEIFRAKMAQPP